MFLAWMPKMFFDYKSLHTKLKIHECWWTQITIFLFLFYEAPVEPFDMQFDIHLSSSTAMQLAEINHAIYFSQWQLLFEKEEDWTAFRKKLSCRTHTGKYDVTPLHSFFYTTCYLLPVIKNWLALKLHMQNNLNIHIRN